MAMDNPEWQRNREYLLGRDIEIVVPAEPVSLQASARRKEELKNLIMNKTRDMEFMFLGDVSVEIEWQIHERVRYESDSSPDVDNIIKPILDAMCGPDGILVDDCQVQSITSSWIDWNRDEQMVTIRLRRLLPVTWAIKRGLVFIRFDNNLCLPISTNELPPAGILAFLYAHKSKIDFRQRLLDAGVDYYQAQLVMPGQRLFHYSKLRVFRDRSQVYEYNQYRADLEAHVTEGSKMWDAYQAARKMLEDAEE
jgi:Holliday junction resolvase RusA-like endonuclease